MADSVEKIIRDYEGSCGPLILLERHLDEPALTKSVQLKAFYGDPTKEFVFLERTSRKLTREIQCRVEVHNIKIRSISFNFLPF